MSPKFFRCDRRLAACATAFALLAFFGTGAARGDDRDLLRQAVADPYLFILLDTSGSMSWSPKDTTTCPTGDCYVPKQADDPASKFYQAKQALYQVLTGPNFPKAYLGFATYNQDTLGVKAKHWLYQASTNGISIPGGGFFPAAGSQDVFGLTWTCDTGTGDNDIGCTSSTPARLSDAWEATRVRRLPKGGFPLSTSTQTDFYVSASSVAYKVSYKVKSGTYGSNLVVTVSIGKCTNSSCSSLTALSGSPMDITFISKGDFLAWDFATSRTNPQLGYFPQNTVSDSSVASTASTSTSPSCFGWDPNDDTNADKSNSYDLRYPTASPQDSRGADFTLGDIVPLDWKVDHMQEVLRRLAPNTGSGTPDFGIASYFKDNRITSPAETFLRLKDDNQRPLIAQGSTPIGASLADFKAWYTTWSARAKDASQADYDSSFNCRNKFILLLTDGDESCNGDPCAVANQLRSLGVTVFVVAFGVTQDSADSTNKLNCIADADHTFFPQDQAELINDLQRAVAQINEDTRAFASAAVPSVQAEVADRIYLSSFRPVGDDGAAFWDGHLDSYLKPLPLKNGKPNSTLNCPATGGSQPRTSCHLWDAGAVLLTQAPTQADLDAAPSLTQSVLRLGLNNNQRRVFYAKENTAAGPPATLRLLAPPTGAPATDPDWSDLWKGFKLPTPVTTQNFTDTKTRIQSIMKTLLVTKAANIQQTGLPDLPITYVLGDIFHADPVVVDHPNDFTFYSNNSYGTKGLSSDCVNDPGYRCYAKKHQYRRKLLLVGANDGQLHAFDGGVWVPDAASPDKGRFNEGTGTELFSYIPRIAMPIVRDQAELGHQIFGVDGTPRIDDVYIDPVHNGTPDATQREWRTVAIGGFREGGSKDGGGRVADFNSGYYALDITQPDQLAASRMPINQQAVPSCLSLQNQTVSGCGTLPYPAVLWEWNDMIGTSLLDEDQNGFADLGQTWSVPTVGRIRVIENTKEVDKFVAIFAGGMDADNKTSTKRGNWLYMLDIETGKVIYKRALVGATPSDVAALDTDLDGNLDTLYVGTLAGFLYKVDISSRGTLQTVVFPKQKALPPLAADTTVTRITDTSWNPFPIFDTGGKPIYIAPTSFFVSALGRYAISFGTGDREALWNKDGQTNRFYLLIDDGFTASQVATGVLPKKDTNYQQVLPGGAQAGTTADFVLSPTTGKDKGWYIALPANERVITQTFGLAGVVTFASFNPDDPGETRPCARGGISHVYVLYANNANAVMSDNGTPVRFRTVGFYVTNPYVEQGSTKNPPTGTPTPNSEDLDATQKAIMEAVKKFFPKGTKFANYWISISGVRSDTGYERYATIPVGIIEKNWKEQ
jgi:uncharacterized protein YegL